MKIIMKITPETTIEEIVEKYPSLIKILADYGIVCVVCGEPIWGTLKEVAESKGIKNVRGMVEKLNENLRK